MKTSISTHGWPIVLAPVVEKNILFFHWLAYAPLSKIDWLYLCISISGLYSIGLFVYSFANTMLS